MSQWQTHVVSLVVDIEIESHATSILHNNDINRLIDGLISDSRTALALHSFIRLLARSRTQHGWWHG